MENQSLFTRYKPILLVVGAVFLVAVIFSIYQQFTFRITGITPKPSTVASSTPVFKVKFNKALSDHGIAVTSDPMVVESTSVSGNTLNIKLKTPLKDQQKYTLTITTVFSTNGQQVGNKKYTFTAKDIDPSTLPSDQQQTILQNQKQTPAITDPIVSHLPYATIDYRIDPQITTDANNKQTLVIQAQLYILPGAGSDADQANQAKQKVLDYIRSLGFDPANYNIQYQNVVQSISGT